MQKSSWHRIFPNEERLTSKVSSKSDKLPEVTFQVHRTVLASVCPRLVWSPPAGKMKRPYCTRDGGGPWANAHRARQEHARSTPGARQERTRSTPGATQEHARSAPGARQEHARSTPGARQERARSTPGARREQPRSMPGTRQERARSAFRGRQFRQPKKLTAP
jgi:hypothetical protein